MPALCGGSRTSSPRVEQSCPSAGKKEGTSPRGVAAGHRARPLRAIEGARVRTALLYRATPPSAIQPDSIRELAACEELLQLRDRPEFSLPNPRPGGAKVD